MGLFNNFPYTDFHRLNLDWILKFTKSVRDRLDLIDAAVTDAQAARDDAEQSALEARTSRDVASQAASDAEDFKTTAQAAAGQATDARAAAEAAQMSAQQSAQTASSKASQAGTSATQAAQSATQASGSATAAAGSATAAAGSAAQSADAEAWAVGTQGGVPVPSTAEQYNNNAKYWAEQAGLAPGANIYAISNEYFDTKTLTYTNWGYRYATAVSNGVLLISISEEESNSSHLGQLAVSIAKMVNGVAVEYAVTIEDGTADPSMLVAVDAVAFMKVNAGDVIRLGAYRHDYLSGTPTMTADTNIIAIGTTLTIDNNYTPAI